MDFARFTSELAVGLPSTAAVTGTYNTCASLVYSTTSTRMTNNCIVVGHPGVIVIMYDDNDTH